MTTPLPVSPFINPDIPRFELDEAAFMAAITGEEPAPKFLADPSDEFMNAMWTRPIVDVIAGHLR